MVRCVQPWRNTTYSFLPWLEMGLQSTCQRWTTGRINLPQDVGGLNDEGYPTLLLFEAR